MTVHLVIDGYNLTGVMGLPEPSNLEGTREELIKRLSIYRRIKGTRITVVFDGKRSGSLSRSCINRQGIEIIYSKEGEEADEVLKEMARAKRQNMTLVTSDRAVASFAETNGVIAISSYEFDALLSRALYCHEKGVTEEDEEDTASSRKKGNPRRLSKQERKRMQRMKKL